MEGYTHHRRRIAILGFQDDKKSMSSRCARGMASHALMRLYRYAQ